MRPLRIVSALAVMLLLNVTAQATFTYQIDNNVFDSSMNVSDTSETRDNWIGNVFTIQAGAEKITHVQFHANDSWPVTLGIYRDNGDGTPPQAATLLYQQNFTSTASAWNDIVLTTPQVLAAGDKMVVGIFAAAVPGDKYPYSVSKDTTLGRSYWDRNYSTALGDPSNYPMNMTDLSKAVGTNQALIPGGWVPANDNCSTVGIRAVGEVVPEPASLCLLALSGLMLRRKRS